MTDTNQASAGETGAAAPRGVSTCVGPALSALVRGFFPDETRQHFRNARIEMLKGFRSILDARIQHLSRGEQKGTTVTVE
jgi:hypothetical protein